MTRWQPIDTAPKDGTEILASDFDAVEIITWRKEGFDVRTEGEWINRDGNYFFPSCWQPLPDHPPLPSEEEAP